MDDWGRGLDKIFIERLWRSVKYEDIYLKEYRTVPEMKRRISGCFRFDNTERLHQSLGYKTPDEVYASVTGGDACIVDTYSPIKVSDQASATAEQPQAAA